MMHYMLVLLIYAGCVGVPYSVMLNLPPQVCKGLLTSVNLRKLVHCIIVGVFIVIVGLILRYSGLLKLGLDIEYVDKVEKSKKSINWFRF